MRRSRNIKLILIAASFLFLFGGMIKIVIADAEDSQASGMVSQIVVKLDQCADCEDIAPTSCCDIQNCVNCYDVLGSISIPVDNSADKITCSRPVSRRQIDTQPHFRPPRIS